MYQPSQLVNSKKSIKAKNTVVNISYHIGSFIHIDLFIHVDLYMHTFLYLQES